MKVRLTVPVATRPDPIRAHGTAPALTPPGAIRPAATPALLRVGRAAAGAAVLAIAVAACSSGGTPTSSTTPSPHVTTSTASGGASRTPSPSTSGTGKSSATDKATSTVTTTATARATVTATPTHRATATPSAIVQATTPRPAPTVTHFVTQYYPVGAPQTGGGGTAGLQDAALFGVGGAAILAGFGSLAYRRRLTRKRRAEAATRPTAPTHTPVP
jgi:hypothetical protein